jgi:hypothetical protein
MFQNAIHVFLFLPFGLGAHHNAIDPNDNNEEILNVRPTYSWQQGQVGANLDFGHHQVISAVDHSVASQYQFIPEILANWLSLTCFGFLNDHTLHHLFPTVDHSKHKLLRKVFEETCKEFHIPYTERNAVNIAKSFHRYTQKHQIVPIVEQSKL